MSNLPLFTYTEIPAYINPLVGDLRKMSYDEFREFCTKLSEFIINTYEQRSHPLMMGNKPLSDIIEKFKQYASDTSSILHTKDDFVYAPKSFSGIVYPWFPEIAEVRTSRVQDIISFIRNIESFTRNLDRTCRRNSLKAYDDSDPLFPKILTQSLRIGSGAQLVSNFSPALARWLYVKYLNLYFPNDQSYTIFDPCMGWGGRMLGALGTADMIQKDITFIGTDVNTSVHNRFDMIHSFWYEYILNSNANKFFDIPKVVLKKWTTPAEDLHLNSEFLAFSGKGHIAFTSPPYFNKEWYSTDINQSFIRYKTYEEWRDGFLTGLIKNVHMFLKDSGIFMLNIANVTHASKDYHTIEDDSCRISKEFGFKQLTTLKMQISMNPAYMSIHKMNLLGNAVERDKNDGNALISEFFDTPQIESKSMFMRYEPIFVFQK